MRFISYTLVKIKNISFSSQLFSSVQLTYIGYIPKEKIKIQKHIMLLIMGQTFMSNTALADRFPKYYFRSEILTLFIMADRLYSPTPTSPWATFWEEIQVQKYRLELEI